VVRARRVSSANTKLQLLLSHTSRLSIFIRGKLLYFGLRNFADHSGSGGLVYVVERQRYLVEPKMLYLSSNALETGSGGLVYVVERQRHLVEPKMLYLVSNALESTSTVSPK
jgi:hypothetical protein